MSILVLVSPGDYIHPVLSAGSAHHNGPQRPGDLHRGGAHSTARTVDQHRLAWAGQYSRPECKRASVQACKTQVQGVFLAALSSSRSLVVCPSVGRSVGR